MKKKDFFEATTEDIEKALQGVGREAIKETHDLGLPTTHGDRKGVFKLYPDGRKEYIKIYSEENNEPK